jgi:chaperonin GroEL
MEIASGYLSPHFVTDTASAEVRLEKPFILIVEARLASIHPTLEVLEQVVKSNRSLLVVAEEVEGEALATLVVNKIRGSLRCCAIKASGAEAHQLMTDVAILTSGTLISDDTLVGVRLNDLGRAETVVVTADRTRIIGGASLN